jgi:hypothetical protein
MSRPRRLRQVALIDCLGLMTKQSVVFNVLLIILVILGTVTMVLETVGTLYTDYYNTW